MYENEAEVGKALKACNTPRSEIFVTVTAISLSGIDRQTKLWGTYHTRASQGLEESLENLGLEYVDCKACSLSSTDNQYI
jgi:diketogulonate reductase-like aldo/keto reductase